MDAKIQSLIAHIFIVALTEPEEFPLSPVRGFRLLVMVGDDVLLNFMEEASTDGTGDSFRKALELFCFISALKIQEILRVRGITEFRIVNGTSWDDSNMAKFIPFLDVNTIRIHPTQFFSFIPNLIFSGLAGGFLCGSPVCAR